MNELPILPALLWALLLVGIAVFAAWPFLQADPERAPDAALLLDAEATLRSDGTEFAFSVRRPATILVQIQLPELLEGTVRVGPAAPASPRDIAYVPRAEDDVEFVVRGRGTPPLELKIMAVGPQFIRIEPIPTAMGDQDLKVRAVVRAMPIE